VPCQEAWLCINNTGWMKLKDDIGRPLSAFPWLATSPINCVYEQRSVISAITAISSQPETKAVQGPRLTHPRRALLL
jgi:hypothetical protein